MQPSPPAPARTWILARSCSIVGNRVERAPPSTSGGVRRDLVVLGLVVRFESSLRVCRMDGLRLRFDGHGLRTGSTGAVDGGTQTRAGAGKHQRIFKRGH